MATTTGMGPAPAAMIPQGAPPAPPAARPAAPAKPVYFYTGEKRAEIERYSDDMIDGQKLPVFVRPGVNCADCHPKKKDEPIDLSYRWRMDPKAPYAPFAAAALPWPQGTEGSYPGPVKPSYAAIDEAQVARLKEVLTKDTAFTAKSKTELVSLLVGLSYGQPLPKAWDVGMLAGLHKRLSESADGTDKRLASQLFFSVSHHPDLKDLSRHLMRERKIDMREAPTLPLNKEQWQDLMHYSDVGSMTKYAVDGLTSFDPKTFDPKTFDPRSLNAPVPPVGLLQAVAPRMTAEQADKVIKGVPEFFRADSPAPSPYGGYGGYNAKPPNLDVIHAIYTQDARSRTALAGCKALAFEHPDAAVRTKALARYMGAFSNKEEAMKTLTKDEAQRVYGEALKGGPVGEAAESLNVNKNLRCLHPGDVSKLHNDVFKDLMEICKDPSRGMRFLPPGLKSTPEQIKHHQQMLKDLGLMAIASSAKSPDQLRKLGVPNLDKEAAQRMFQRLMCQPAAKAVIEGLRQEALNGSLADQNGRVIENAEYLRGPKFRDRLLMLSGGDTSKLNEKQVRLIMDEIGTASAFSKDPKANQKMMQDVMGSLVGDTRFGFALKPEDLAAVQTEVDQILKDPKVSEDERNALASLTDGGKVTVTMALKLLDLKRAISTGQNPLLVPGPIANKISGLAVGARFAPLFAKAAGPLGTAVAIVSDYNSVTKAFEDGDTRTLALRGSGMALTAAGAGLAGYGAVALACGASGPPGWIVGGLLLAGAGLSAAASIWGESEVESACNRLGIKH